MTEQSTRPDFVIFHATDLAPDGGVAFEHSVAMARDGGAKLYSVHAATLEPERETRPMPNPTPLLESWGDDTKLEFVARTHECCEDPVDTLLDAMREVVPDLLVVGTHQRTGFNRAFQGSIAEGLANNSEVPTLLLPIGKKGFVRNGRLELRRVLIPIGNDADFQGAVKAATQFADRMGLTTVDFHLLHVGAEDVLDDALAPEHDGWSWIRSRVDDDDLSEAIEQYCRDNDIDLVVMGTRQQDGLLDVITGTKTQQTARRIPCPMLAVPID